MKRGTVEFLIDDSLNEAGEESGWLTIAYKTGKHKYFMPWQRATKPGSSHVVGVRCTRETDTTWKLDEENGQHWFERVVTTGTEPIKSEVLKPRPAGTDRSMADFDNYYDTDDVEEKPHKHVVQIAAEPATTDITPDPGVESVEKPQKRDK